MPATTVRTQDTYQAIHMSDPDWKDVARQWITDAGVDPEVIDGLISQMEENGAALPYTPWLVLTPGGIMPVPPTNFVQGFEDVNATDVLNEIWQERRSHPDRGYTAQHDDANPSSHLINEALRQLTPLVAQNNILPDEARRQDLIKAASLIVAAIDKIDRAYSVRTFSVD